MANRVWKFFASVKLSVAILLSLAATSVIGTLVPQNGDPATYLQQYGETLFNLFRFLNVFDLYHSLWFRALLCLLMLNIIVCSINRLTATWKIIFPTHPHFDAHRYEKAKNRLEWTSETPPQTLRPLFENFLEKRFSILAVEPVNDGHALFAEKGRWTRLGVYGVHFSVILMVLGGLIGSIMGFDGAVEIPEGGEASHVTLAHTRERRALDFTIRCDDFNISYYDTGMPREYRSSLTLIRDGKPVRRKDIRVNDPLRFEGINIFQSSYGETPSDRFTVTFTEKGSGLLYDVEAEMGKPIDMPGNSGKLSVVDFRSNFSFRGFNLGDTFICNLQPKNGEPETILVSTDHPRFDFMRQGDYAVSISNVKYKPYTGLQVTRDPGVPVVYAGFLLMIIGCYITFFMFHQSVCIFLAPSGEGSRVTLAGISGKNRPGMNAVIARAARHLQQLDAPTKGTRA